MKLKILLVFYIVVLVGSVAGFTSCPSDAEFEDAIRSAIVNYFANPNEENLNILKDLVEFYSTHDLSTADCSDTGKSSGVEIQGIYDSAGKVSETVKEAFEGIIDVNLMINDGSVDGSVLLVDDVPSTYSGSGDYELKVLDSNKNTLWSQSFKLSYMYNQTLSDMPFDLLGYRIPYDPNMYELKLYKKGDNIFSKQLSFCDNNGVCDYSSETPYSCATDCGSPLPHHNLDGAVSFDKTLNKDSQIYSIEGVECGGGFLWAAEPSYKSGVKVFKIDANTGSVVSSYTQKYYTVGVSNVIGLAYDSANNYIFNHVFPYGPIYVVDANPPYSEVRKFNAPANWIHDIAFDGTYLWGVDGISPGYIYKINAATGNLIKRIYAPAAGGNPTGVAFDGQYLWITAGGFLFQIDQNKAVADGHSENAILHRYSISVGGRLGWDGSQLWTQDSTHFYRLKLPTTQPVKLKILAVPIRWDDNDAFKAEFETRFNEVFLKQLPIYNCKDSAVKIDWIDVNNGFNDFHCGWLGDCRIKSFVNYLKQNKYNPGDYRLILGLINEDEFSKTDCGTTVAGCNNRDIGNNIAWANSENIFTLAHETGHLFDLSDQYCSNQAGSTSCLCNDGGIKPDECDKKDINYLDAGLDCDPRGGVDCCEVGGLPACDPTFWPGDWSPRGYHVCCYGNSVGKTDQGVTLRETMTSGDFLRGGFDTHSLDHLKNLPELKCN